MTAEPMRSLPAELMVKYRIATGHMVRSWSFGEVKTPRRAEAVVWKDRRGTLQDEAIFGPVRDFECACGKYRGKTYEKMICDRCGVKITTASSRRTRFGHIELPRPERHPLGSLTDELRLFPLIPTAFIESLAGGHLATAYDLLVAASSCGSREGIRDALNQIVEVLLPNTTEAHLWNLHEAEIFARGLALEPAESPDKRCPICGYALEGLAASSCPGCGHQIKR